MKKFNLLAKVGSMKSLVAIGLCASGSLSGLAEAQTVDDIPAKYVNVCYGWLTDRNETGNLSPEQLLSALQQILAQSPAVPGRTAVEMGAIRAALRWSETLDEKKDCYRAPIGIINVQAAVQLVQRNEGERNEKARANAQKEFIDAHVNDPVTIDYNEYQQSIAGKIAKSRKPAGMVKNLTLSQYLAWEKKMKDKWASSVMNAGRNANVMQAHSQCKADIANQWRTSFGYVDAVLHSPALVEKGVTRGTVTSIACMTEFVQAAGIPVTNSLSKVGTTARF